MPVSSDLECLITVAGVASAALGAAIAMHGGRRRVDQREGAEPQEPTTPPLPRTSTRVKEGHLPTAIAGHGINPGAKQTHGLDQPDRQTKGQETGDAPRQRKPRTR